MLNSHLARRVAALAVLAMPLVGCAAGVPAPRREEAIAGAHTTPRRAVLALVVRGQHEIGHGIGVFATCPGPATEVVGPGRGGVARRDRRAVEIGLVARVLEDVRGE